MSYRDKRIVLLSGHYGSGKTNVAVNLAMELKKTEERVSVADLDIVNPYFRTLDSKDDLDHAGIRLIVSEYANTNLDVPALPQEIYTIVDDTSSKVIIDVGGDERGALALGRISDRIKEENDYEMLLVINMYRPLTRDAKSVLEVMREIEIAGGIPFTGIVNDSNLGAETDAETVLKSLPFADEVSELTGLPVVMTAVEEGLYEEVKDKVPECFPLKLQKRPV
ncbi:MAG: P-loop NTPase [Lachnospiraceae bacterium]|nr:P-loop NTPase [Lachnospiraceae bacterium]